MASPETPRVEPAVTPTEPRVVALDQPFDHSNLYPLRAAVAAHASELGLSPGRVGELVLIANELASNAVRHGGGHGRLRLWVDGGLVICEVTDTGTGLPNPGEVGRQRAAIGELDGRGLWIVRQLSDEFTVDSDGSGTRITIRFRFD